jgi:hypothetical protein
LSNHFILYDMQIVELEYQDWLFKLAERLQIVTIQINNQQDISDDDYDRVLRPLHEAWYEGEIVFTKSQQEPMATNCHQGGLFDDRVSDNS